MTLPAQKFANTFRTINGLINIVYDSDVILLCDTSLGAVSVDLAEIPADLWNTVYKLYVIDKSNNASVNNITIKAPIGYTVNNASTFVVNVNGGSAIVRIVSNTAYVAETNYGFPSGIIVKDEGVVIATSTTSMNFVGAGVTATAVGSAVTVNIAGASITPTTFANLTTLISGNTVIAGQFYLVTDAIFTNTVLENVPIVVQGITTNSVSLSGSGIFLNADYQLVGNYSGVSGFVSNLGVWQSTLVPVIGSVVMWDNLQYVNTTGLNGISNPSLDAVNWTVLTKSTTNGYIQEIDEVTYNVSNNQILTRADKRHNFIENNLNNLAPLNEAFLLFQWGNNQVADNKVEANSIFECWNNYVIGNPVGIPSIEGNYLHESKLSLLKNFGKIQKNLLSANTSVLIIESQVDVLFASNIFEQDVNSNFTLKDQSVFRNNKISQKVALTVIGGSTASFLLNDLRHSTVTVNNQGGTFDSNLITHGGLSISNLTNDCSSNVINKGLIIITNLSGIFYSNYLSNCSVTLGTIIGEISTNRVEQNSTLTITNCGAEGSFRENILDTKSNVSITNLDGLFGLSAKGFGNKISASIIEIGTIVIICEFSTNVIEQDSFVVFTSLSAPSGQVVNNTLKNAVINVGINSLEISGCEFFNTTWQGGLPNSQVLFGGSTTSYINTIRYSIDMSDPTVYDLPTQTLIIPLNLRTWVGTFRLLNSAGLTVSKIIGLNVAHATCLFPDSGTLTFVSVAVAGALGTEIVSSGGATSYALVNHTVNLADKIYITKDEGDILNRVFLINIIT
jgi:hypothetical protein